MNFFSEYANSFNVLGGTLRECQIGGFCAARAHFSTSNEPCLLSMPTGSEKTGLMMALAFGFKARRVLIISPARILSSQLAAEFESLQDLRDTKTLHLRRGVKPKVISLDVEMRTEQQWQKHTGYDVITATTRTTSPQLPNVVAPPNGFFDLVFIDEAHHEPASTWRSLIECFEKRLTKIVLLTGTPYRRDHSPIGGKLTYVYPIARALNDGIYATVQFVTAGDPAREMRDHELAKRGVQQLNRLCSASAKPLMLVKTDRVAHAKELLGIYRSLGIRIETIHSEQSGAVNEKHVIDARKGKIAGLIVVGMLGEGLNIPELKVAVFHRNPQSLPYTLQLIGRLARVPPGLRHGVVVACSSDFTADTFRLYEGSEDWLQLIPQLEHQLIGPAEIRLKQAVEDNGSEIELGDARPFFVVSALRRTSRPKRKSLVGCSFRTSKGNASAIIDHVWNQDLRVVITVTNERPDWLRSHGRSSANNRIYNLHCFYFGENNLTITHSTDESLGKKIQESLFSSKKLQPNDVEKVLSVRDGTYSTVGLQNTSGLSGLNASYKMLMGVDAEMAITNADRNSSTAGHCMMKLGTAADAEWRGIAFKNSKIWSLQRDSLGNFRVWMGQLVDAVAARKQGSLPRLTNLRRSIPLDEFPSPPIAALWSPTLLSYTVKWERGPDVIMGLPLIEIVDSWTNRSGKLNIGEVEIQVEASISDAYLSFASQGDCEWTVIVDSGKISQFSVKEFLEEFPVTLLFRDGSSALDGIYSKPSAEPTIDYNCCKEQLWNGCLITKEIPNGLPPQSVHEFVQTQLSVKPATILIYDHGTREVADYIEFDSATETLSFYHCKGSGSINPGTRRDDLEELVAQTMAGLRWVRSARITSRIEKRRPNNGAVIVCGTVADWEKAKIAFEPTAWSYRVVMVQPGLSLTKLRTHAGQVLRPLLAAASDYSKMSGASLNIFCSN